jgi:hypothetical protein
MPALFACVFTVQFGLDGAVVSVFFFSTCLYCSSPNYIRKQFLISPTTDLPKTVNKPSAPITFAHDSNILFSHYNLTDFNKNIHTFFATLNK